MIILYRIRLVSMQPVQEPAILSGTQTPKHINHQDPLVSLLLK